MENRPRIPNFGVPETDPATGRVYHVANDRQGQPNAVMAVTTRAPLGDIGNRVSDYKPTMNKPKVIILINRPDQ